MVKSEVIKHLKDGVSVVEFNKVNGEYRQMKCTLNEKYLPEQIDLEESVQKKKPNPEVLAVYDVEVKGWRSFRWDKLKTVDGIEFSYGD